MLFRSIQARGITPDYLVLENKENEGEADEGAEQFFREKDLRHHLKNGDKTEPKPTPKTIEESGLISDAVTIDEKTKEVLNNDNQLTAALLVLKSMNLKTASSAVQ